MSEIFTIICALLGVIGLIFITYYAVRWLNKKFRGAGWNGPQNGIKIVECMGIAQDKQLLVIEVGRKAMLLGVTPNSVTKLSDLDDADLAEIRVCSQKGGSSFADSFKSIIAGGKKSGSADGSVREDDYKVDENNDF
ncbi:MAG: flagellar biosynthetic protein FliO [Oscillospiraceae bacterium]|nr:flagellar biosynthetic protein FliO [Oscillospiraceae bacterium]